MKPRMAWMVIGITAAFSAPVFAQSIQPEGATLGKPIAVPAADRDSEPSTGGRALRLPAAEPFTPIVVPASHRESGIAGNEKPLRILANQPPTPIGEPNPILGPVDGSGLASPFVGRYSLRGDVGNGVGYQRGFTGLEAMIPLQETNGSLFFSDLRIVNFQDENRWEGNAGLGYRWFSEPVNRILGVNCFYDARKTNYHTYQQLGVGFEALSPCLEFRLNGYFITGQGHRQVGDIFLINQGVINGNNVISRFQRTELARGGVDLDIGGRLPIADRIAPRAYLGLYSYSAERAATANGVRGRLEAQLTQQVSAHFAIQHDRVFDTTVTGGLAIHFGAPAYRTGNSGRASWEDVMRQRLQRDVNIVISEDTTTYDPIVTPVPKPALPKKDESEEGPR